MRAVAVVAGLASAAACGIGDGQALADAIAKGGRVAVDAPSQRGTLTIELEIDESGIETLEGGQRDAFEALAGGDGVAGATNPSLVLDVDADLSAQLASVSTGDRPVAVFDGRDIYVRRQNARATEKRVWAALDLVALTSDERPLVVRELPPEQVLQAVAVGLNPGYIVEFAAGALAGSTELAGRADVAGVETDHYRAKVALEQLVDRLDLDDDETEARLRIHDLLRTRREVMPAEFWIDGEGFLRQLRLELRQQVTRRRFNTITVTLRFDEFGAATTAVPPSEDQTVSYETFGRLVRSGVDAT